MKSRPRRLTTLPNSPKDSWAFSKPGLAKSTLPLPNRSWAPKTLASLVARKIKFRSACSGSARSILIRIDRAEPEHADRNFIFRATKEAKVFGAHDRFGSGSVLFAKPGFENAHESLGEFGSVVSRRGRLFIHGY